MPLILIIEDEPDISDNLRDLLEALGYRTLQAHDGEEGLAMAFEQHPDLVLCDLRLPMRSGHEVLQALRAHGWGATVPFAMMTAHADPKTRSRTLDLGADAFIRKPFAVDDLLGTVESLTGDSGDT